MNRLTALAGALAVAVAITATPADARQQSSDEAERITKSIEVLRELTDTPDNAIPKHLLERAAAIVVIPSLVKGGFIVGAKHGKGVMSVRNDGGAWSAPAFVKMTGGSIGWQIGVESVDLVLLVMNREGVDDLLDDRFTLSGAAGVAAGPVGRQAEAATNITLESQILAYSRSKGLFAGATFEGAALQADDDSNEAFYGADTTLEQAIARPLTAQSGMAATWRSTLERITDVPRR